MVKGSVVPRVGDKKQKQYLEYLLGMGFTEPKEGRK